jgi:2-keto-4-pentenoate hydratase/2-oxohepta-3-ene-1,7-dioic acid hydratase in catechol pathway
MRLVRYGTKNQEIPGILKEDGVINLRNLFPNIPDIGEAFFRNGWPDKIKHIEGPIEHTRTRLGCPVSHPSKIICLGKNYPEHAKEGGFDPPKKPLLFSKAPSSLNGPYDSILLPSVSGQVDWEVELAVVIGKEGKRITKAAALDHIAGFMVMNDISGREAQFSDHQWFRGKSFDTFAPVGPSIVSLDEIGDPYALKLKTLVNGVVMQEGNTDQMVFNIEAILEYISQDITLIPGDIISTGTPSGVGVFRNPPVFLQEGDVVECTIDKIGSLINKIMRE